ncbi:MAG TPA: ABC transporter ATP-binding protein [Candidatus Dormibacteraeota bacterium]|nr:ABC transporter ATP-binding protein [Candidatus Dormibacteraeota bacterium]
MAAGVAVRVRDVSKRFRIYHRRNLTLKQALLQRRRGVFEEFLALQGVSFEVEQGGALGIIGENGSGKSTLLKCIAGILQPDRGSIETHGRVAALLELGAGFHPEYTGRENVYLNGALIGLPRRYIDRVMDEIVAFSELERFIDNPVRTYSSGMYARLGFSIAVHLDPDVLVVDEVLAVGDEAFQQRCYDRIARMRAEGRTLIMVSHALEPIREFCSDCIWLDRGQVRERGSAATVVARYLAEVNARESALMAGEVERVHQLVPSGRGGVGVTRVRFEGADGPTHVFETGDPFEMVIEYHAPARLEGARFSVGFQREDGVMAFSTTTEDTELAASSLPPRGEVRLRIPSLPLLEGLFRASVSISDARSGEPYTILENAFPFRVRSQGVKEKGMALLGHRWELPAAIARRSVEA